MQVGVIGNGGYAKRDVTRAHGAREVTEGVVVRREIDDIVVVVNHHLCTAVVLYVSRSADRVKHAIPINIPGHPVVDTINDILCVTVYGRIFRVPLRPPRCRVSPIGSVFAPPECVVVEPSGLLIAGIIAHSGPTGTTEIIHTTFGVHQNLVGIECMQRVKDLGKAGNG